MDFTIHEEFGYCQDIPEHILEHSITLYQSEEDEDLHEVYIDIPVLTEYFIPTCDDAKLLEHFIKLAAYRIEQLNQERSNTARASEWNVLGDK